MVCINFIFELFYLSIKFFFFLYVVGFCNKFCTILNSRFKCFMDCF